jgi:5-methylcytosine-specific restriction protein A
MGMFVPGTLYRRRALHRTYGGQAQGGISSPSNHPIILLFTGEAGEAYGYKDGWTPEGVFEYTGEGQRGDMTFVRGNRAILEHARDGKDLYLFEQSERGHARYVGQMICTGYQERTGPDKDGRHRKVIVFELTPLDALDDKATSELDEETASERSLWTKDLNELRRMAGEASSRPSTARERKSVARVRSRAVRVYVLKRADGICEGCGDKAPFSTPEGRPYLEPHHIRRLSDGGPDDPQCVAGLCPNCHRRAHYSKDANEFNSTISEFVTRMERSLGGRQTQ